jgi:ribosome maturation factor RimP
MSHQQLEQEIEDALAAGFPDVELVDLEERGGYQPILTLYIDRPGGVDLDFCAQVTRALDQLRDRYSLEVSSPGLDRRLRKPAHFLAVAGETVAVRTSAPLGGQRNFRGRLTAADNDGISLTLESGESVSIPYTSVARANVIFKFDDNGGQRE